MAKVITLNRKGNESPISMTLKKLFCDDCGFELKYWLSVEEDVAYGICDQCHLNMPSEVAWSESIQDSQLE